MSISSVGSNSFMMQMQQTQRPSASDLTSKVMESSDIDGDSLLSIDELGLSEEDFNSFDSDLDGSISSSELEDTITSKLDAMKNQELTPDSFASFLSDMGVEVPQRPSHGGPDASKMASEIFTKNDTDEDGVLSIDELGIEEELFTSFDSDEDGSITQDELEKGLKTLFESVESGEKTKEEVGDVLTELGVEPPQGERPDGQGRPPGGGGGQGSSEEEYDEADTNEDGVVSTAEQAAYDGTTEDTDYTMQLVGTLLEALKGEEDESSTENLDLSKFKSVMSMVNNETQEPQIANKLNAYVSNLDLGLKTA